MPQSKQSRVARIVPCAAVSKTIARLLSEFCYTSNVQCGYDVALELLDVVHEGLIL